MKPEPLDHDAIFERSKNMRSCFRYFKSKVDTFEAFTDYVDSRLEPVSLSRTPEEGQVRIRIHWHKRYDSAGSALTSLMFSMIIPFGISLASTENCSFFTLHLLSEAEYEELKRRRFKYQAFQLLVGIALSVATITCSIFAIVISCNYYFDGHSRNSRVLIFSALFAFSAFLYPNYKYFEKMSLPEKFRWIQKGYFNVLGIKKL